MYDCIFMYVAMMAILMFDAWIWKYGDDYVMAIIWIYMNIYEYEEKVGHFRGMTNHQNALIHTCFDLDSW